MRQCPFAPVPCQKGSGDIGRHYSDEPPLRGRQSPPSFLHYHLAATSPQRDHARHKQEGAMAVRLNKEPLSDGARKFVGGRQRLSAPP